MKCDKCGKNNADTHIKRVINGEFEEYDLCDSCAKEYGYGNVFTNIDSMFQESFGSLLGGFFSNALPARSQATRCEICGTAYGDITATGKLGCSNCYSIFAQQLMPTISRIHGNITHCGKRSALSGKEENVAQAVEPQKENQVDILKAQLKEAIENQEFEKAAELRDKIKELEA